MSHLKHSFGMIVHNGKAFVHEVVASVYDFAHEIVIVEGSEPPAAFMATPEGGSVDGTAEVLKTLPDPQHKITVIYGGKFPNKTAQCNVYMKRVTGDYIWELDSDEAYLHEDLLLIDSLLAAGKYEAVEVPFRHFWRDAYHLARDTWWEVPIRRIFRRQSGDLYKGHRPPELVRKPWKQMKLLTGAELARRGVYCYHYGFVDNQRTKWKVAYHCSRGYAWRDYFPKQWIGDTAGHYLNKPSQKNRVEAYSGKQPPSILASFWGRKKKISVLHVLPSWSRGGGCTCVRDLIDCSNLGYFHHGVYISGYGGASPFRPGVPFHTKDFASVARKYDVVEFMFWHSLPELTAMVSMKKPRPKIVVVIPVYNTNALKMYFDRFSLVDAEKREVDHVVFMTDKALGLPENKGIDLNRVSVVPWGPELIWAALDGYHWRRNDPLRIGYVGPFNRAICADCLPEVLGGIPAKHPAYQGFHKANPQQGVRFELFGDGEMWEAFKKRSNAAMIWHGYSPDLASFMYQWDLYVYPMKEMCYCGSELKIQQALASFVPIVIRPSKGLAELGLSKCGFVCKDYSEVVARSRQLLCDVGLRMHFQQAARVHALRELGAHNSTAEMERIYLSLV